MDLANTPFFGMLRQRLDQLSQRQQLIAENIANASTPGYRPRDVDTAAFERMLSSSTSGGGITLARTNAGTSSRNVPLNGVLIWGMLTANVVTWTAHPSEIAKPTAAKICPGSELIGQFA